MAILKGKFTTWRFCNRFPEMYDLARRYGVTLEITEQEKISLLHKKVSVKVTGEAWKLELFKRFCLQMVYG